MSVEAIALPPPEMEPETPLQQQVGELLGRLRQGDEAAMGELCGTVWPDLYSRTRKQGGTPEEAEDVAQITLLTAIEKLDSFQGNTGRGLLAWLRAIAHNRLTDQKRRNARANLLSLEATLSLEGELPVRSEDLGDHMAEAVTDRILISTLLSTQVSPLSAQIIRKTYFDSLTTGQIAYDLNMPQGTVKSSQHRALRRLRSVMASGGELALMPSGVANGESFA